MSQDQWVYACLSVISHFMYRTRIHMTDGTRRTLNYLAFAPCLVAFLLTRCMALIQGRYHQSHQNRRKPNPWRHQRSSTDQEHLRQFLWQRPLRAERPVWRHTTTPQRHLGNTLEAVEWGHAYTPCDERPPALKEHLCGRFIQVLRVT